MPLARASRRRSRRRPGRRPPCRSGCRRGSRGRPGDRVSISPVRSASSSSGDVGGAGDPARLPLVVGAHVDQLGALLDQLLGLVARTTLAGSLTSGPRSGRSIDRPSPRQEGDAHVGPVLVEVLAADPGRDDVDGADVAQRALRLASACLAASSVDVLELPTSSMIFTTAISIPPSESCEQCSLAPTPSSSAARCHGPIVSGRSLAAGAVSARNRSIAAAIAAASSGSSGHWCIRLSEP